MKMWSSLKRFFALVRLYFQHKYFDVYQYLTLKLVLLTNARVRKIIIMKGKDPDYVAPLPVVPKPEPAVFHKKTLKNPLSSVWGGRPNWVKNPNLHPVLQSRYDREVGIDVDFDEEEMPLQVAASDLGALTIEDLEQEFTALTGITKEE